jgi:hypothetical protein
MKDLVCLVADKSIEATVRELLARPQALGIREVTHDLFVHPRRDPGCFHEAHDFLRPLAGSYHHALVIFDRAWEGAPAQQGTTLELPVRDRLQQLGTAGWAEVVVIDPELEVWVWSDSPHVDEQLGWDGHVPPLREWLRAQTLWPEDQQKPPDPKLAVERALRVVRLPRSSSVYAGLAR